MSRSVHLERHRTERIGWLRAAVLGPNDGRGRVRVRQLAGRYRADVARERDELAAQPAFERRELAAIYVARGLTLDLATQVAEQLMAHDALGAHSRNELGVSDVVSARPVQAGVTSAATFAVGAALPVIASLVAPAPHVVPVVAEDTSDAFWGNGDTNKNAGCWRADLYVTGQDWSPVADCG